MECFFAHIVTKTDLSTLFTLCTSFRGSENLSKRKALRNCDPLTVDNLIPQQSKVDRHIHDPIPHLTLPASVRNLAYLSARPMILRASLRGNSDGVLSMCWIRNIVISPPYELPFYLLI